MYIAVLLSCEYLDLFKLLDVGVLIGSQTKLNTVETCGSIAELALPRCCFLVEGGGYGHGCDRAGSGRWVVTEF